MLAVHRTDLVSKPSSIFWLISATLAFLVVIYISHSCNIYHFLTRWFNQLRCLCVCWCVRISLRHLISNGSAWRWTFWSSHICRFAWSSPHTCAAKKNGLLYICLKKDLSALETIGGNWWRSHTMIICTQPNGIKFCLVRRRNWSIQSIISALTIDISSITSVSSSVYTSSLTYLIASLGTLSSVTVIGKWKNEWIVCPPIWSADTPVGASTARDFSVCLKKWRSKVDFPVPAFHVKKICSWVSFMRFSASCACESISIYILKY